MVSDTIDVFGLPFHSLQHAPDHLIRHIAMARTANRWDADTGARSLS
jgi:hypothetical protein